jgi:hypothetical protein
VSWSAYGIEVAPVLLAVMLVVNFGPDTTGQTLRSKNVKVGAPIETGGKNVDCSSKLNVPRYCDALRRIKILELKC